MCKQPGQRIGDSASHLSELSEPVEHVVTACFLRALVRDSEPAKRTDGAGGTTPFQGWTMNSQSVPKDFRDQARRAPPANAWPGLRAGALAYRQGYQRLDSQVMLTVIIVLVLLVTLIQFGGDRLARLLNERL